MSLASRRRGRTGSGTPAANRSRLLGDQQQDTVIESLEEQVALYRRLARLAELQHVHVQHGQTEQLLEVLGARQQVLDLLATLEKTVAPARRDWINYIVRQAPDGVVTTFLRCWSTSAIAPSTAWAWRTIRL